MALLFLKVSLRSAMSWILAFSHLLSTTVHVAFVKRSHLHQTRNARSWRPLSWTMIRARSSRRLLITSARTTD
ncbi:hypothetical protein DEU56DRAFT_828352 [Suillus clintonianus]|uniref:uncharacterized protein n=1 Tax=Suillus clintonianus TaxID=1904413 RepID=UPI001B880820|nr:uncharacterized protein DEU56DRAFT_828352 [Suillus clintonianus]KAG2124037.1 hypothetical protein DEU56DRAFT_828352 [Suillus clintonianus]